ncbi:MAG: hypothetical protein JNM28_11800 [Armatimonadetes bacterium]|nr:hypothetical protein [Armatimonadota bacterium]
MTPTLVSAFLIAGQDQFLLKPQPGVDPLRLAISPIRDGVVTDQEWDQFADTPNGPTFFQWEPGKLHLGAKPKPGQEVVVSLDANGDGWLVGDDNLEIRITMVGDSPRVEVRQLDATDRSGPVWVVPRLLPNSVQVAAKNSTAYWNMEASFLAAGLSKEVKEDSRVGLRIDIVPEGTDTGPAYLPRNLAFLRMRFDKSRNLFSGVVWHPGIRNRAVARLDPLKFNFDFELDPDAPAIQSVDVVGEGYARDAINQVTVPFPALDRKNRATVAYSSQIKESAVGGYRVLRATVLAADGRIAQIRSSFRIADLVDFDFGLPTTVRFSENPQVVKGVVTIKSQGEGKINGRFTMKLPDSWSGRRGQQEDFLIYYPRGTAKVSVEYSIPGGATGTFPVELTAKVGDLEIQKVVYVMIK